MPYLFLLLLLPKIVFAASEPDRAKEEMKYAERVRKPVYADLLRLYDPENEQKLAITYAAFIPENRPRGGLDKGYGLHVVKRLTLDNGETIEVNEAWPEDRETGGILPPDEIRIKARGVFFSIHIAWNLGNGEAAIFFRTRYAGLDQKGRNTQYEMRVPVSAPYSCMGCHAPDSELYKRFLAPDEKRNLKAIVQDSQFRLTPAKMLGYREYVDYLKNERKVAPAFLARVEKKLADPRVATRVPHLTEALRAGVTQWISESDNDLEYEAGRYGRNEYLRRQGVWIDRAGRLRIDALEQASENIFEGKYRYWGPSTLIP